MPSAAVRFSRRWTRSLCCARFASLNAQNHCMSRDLIAHEWAPLPPSQAGAAKQQGLDPDEAHARIGTWRQSWFEEGSRLIYIVPNSFLNTILPRTINPAPIANCTGDCGQAGVA